MIILSTTKTLALTIGTQMMTMRLHPLLEKQNNRHRTAALIKMDVVGCPVIL